ncbi:magnesium transporter MRS2-4-like [Henckelia pumila]|uniref:magnesium transporter MRS2-4-like n=1 Tax=Henckelia pumila TaxID=405737 RepID=UPI003C6E4CDB
MTLTMAAVKKKARGTRLWMRMDRWGQSELVECDKSAIMKRASIPARDLRILGPIFSRSSCTILAREKAMIVNLEYIRAIVTAEEVLLLDPLCQEVLPFADQLTRQLAAGQMQEEELPFELQVLEIALRVVCRYVESSVAELERDAYPALDELAMHVNTKNLESVRTLKTNLTRLLVRAQKVRDEIEHLLDDNENMAQLQLTQKSESMAAADHLSSRKICGSLLSNYHVEDLEMLLEAYFTQLDGTHNKIISVREYINETEDYVYIQLDSRRNELIQMQLVLRTTSLCLSVGVLLTGIFSLNIPCTLYKVNGIFGRFVGCILAACMLLFLLVLWYARWKNLLG